MKNKLIIAFLGSSGGSIEQHNLFVSVGDSYKSSGIIKEMEESWALASHIDDAVLLEELPGYSLELVPLSEEVPLNDERLFVVWIGWYELRPQLGIQGFVLLNTEQHAMFIVVARSQKEIEEKLMEFKPYADGRKLAPGLLSHTDNMHDLSRTSPLEKKSDIDNIVDVNDLLFKKGLKVVLTKNESAVFKGEEFHGFGKFTKLLGKNSI